MNFKEGRGLLGQIKYPRIESYCVQNIFQRVGIMSSHKSTTALTPSLEKSLSNAIETLDHEHTILLLKTVVEKTHFVPCQMAQSYSLLKQDELALEKAMEALQSKNENECYFCLTVAVQSLLKIKDPSPAAISQIQTRIQSYEKTPIVTQLEENLQKLTDKDTLPAFLSTLQKQGARFPKVSLIEQSENYRKIIANQRIEKDEIIMFIPKKNMITLEITKTSPLVKNLYDQKISLRSPKHCLLSIYLLEQRQLGRLSPHYSYIEMLPTSFDSFPINYSEEEMKELRGSSFHDQVQQKIADIKKDYEAILSVDTNFERFSLQEFQWARMTVSSRIFGIVIKKLKTDALVPLADMLNHHTPKQTTWYYSDSDGGFVIRNLKVTEEGSEIFDSYGQKCNSRFLLNYGFTLPNNLSNQVVVSVPLKYSANHEPGIRQLYMRVGRHIQSKQFDELIGLFRYASLNHEQLEQGSTSSENAQSTQFQSEANQRSALQLMEQVTSRQLGEYSTSIKQDKKLLTGKDLTLNMYNCTMLRLGEKEILCFYLTMSRKILKYFTTRKKTHQLKYYEAYLTTLPFYE